MIMMMILNQMMRKMNLLWRENALLWKLLLEIVDYSPVEQEEQEEEDLEF